MLLKQLQKIWSYKLSNVLDMRVQFIDLTNLTWDLGLDMSAIFFKYIATALWIIYFIVWNSDLGDLISRLLFDCLLFFFASSLVSIFFVSITFLTLCPTIWFHFAVLWMCWCQHHIYHKNLTYIYPLYFLAYIYVCIYIYVCVCIYVFVCIDTHTHICIPKENIMFCHYKWRSDF